MESLIRPEDMSCAEEGKWRIILSVCGICSESIPSLEVPGASVLDEFYWLLIRKIPIIPCAAPQSIGDKMRKLTENSI